MTIKVGDRLPNAAVWEYSEVEGEGCSIGPNKYQTADLAKGKRIVIIGLPGAFTPTCSAKHVPGYLERYDALKAKGVDEIWCVANNDAHVMGAWARDQKCGGKIRMIADGNTEFTKALGLEIDRTSAGMGIRSQRYSMLVEDGVVKRLNVETPGKFEVSDAGKMLEQL